VTTHVTTPPAKPSDGAGSPIRRRSYREHMALGADEGAAEVTRFLEQHGG
jgi:hypothetical protein